MNAPQLSHWAWIAGVGSIAALCTIAADVPIAGLAGLGLLLWIRVLAGPATAGGVDSAAGVPSAVVVPRSGLLPALPGKVDNAPDTDGAVRIDRELQQKNLELRTREAELMHLMAELECVSESKDQYLSEITHELRTPLTSIRAYSEMLAEFCGDESPEVRDDFLRVIVNESERLTRLINDLLDLARLESGQETFAPQRVELQEVMNRCLKCLAGLSIERMVTFKLDASATVIHIEGDPDRLQQAFTNVLANAARFSPVGGEVEVGMAASSHRCRIVIRDHGPGIPDAELESVFDRFVQATQSKAAGRSGTGLGLSITRQIIQRHGGAIFCRNHAEGGAEFVLKLPLAVATAVV